MSAKRRVLIAGKSWTVHSIHQKGFDSFTTTEYAEGVQWLRAALEGAGWDITYQPAHVAAREFPFDAGVLSAFDCVMLSDIGSNTLLLHPDTFVRSRVLPNRLAAIRDYVANGGGLVMIGGYMTFQGIDGKARYRGRPSPKPCLSSWNPATTGARCRKVCSRPCATPTTRSPPTCRRSGRPFWATIGSPRSPMPPWSQRSGRIR